MAFDVYHLHGVIPPLVTPMHPDGSLNLAAMPTLVEAMLDAGVQAVFTPGSQSEAYALSADEQATLRRLARVQLHADGRPFSQLIDQWLTWHQEARTLRNTTNASPVATGAAPERGQTTARGQFDTASGEFRFECSLIGPDGRATGDPRVFSRPALELGALDLVLPLALPPGAAGAAPSGAMGQKMGTSSAASVTATGIANMIRVANTPPRTRIPTFIRQTPLSFASRPVPLRTGRFPFVALLVDNFAGAANVLSQCNFIFIPIRCQ